MRYLNCRYIMTFSMFLCFFVCLTKVFGMKNTVNSIRDEVPEVYYPTSRDEFAIGGNVVIRDQPIAAVPGL